VVDLAPVVDLELGRSARPGNRSRRDTKFSFITLQLHSLSGEQLITIPQGVCQ